MIKLNPQSASSRSPYSFVAIALMVAGCSGPEVISTGPGNPGLSGGSPASNSTSAALGGLTFGSGGWAATGGSSVTGGSSPVVNSPQGGNAATGGSWPTSGVSQTGGALASGGTKATGGANVTGGVASSGGKQTSSGSLSTGGGLSTGGMSTGGAAPTGGRAATGGAAATGGTVAAAGSSCVAAATGGPTGMNTGQGCPSCHTGSNPPGGIAMTLAGTVYNSSSGTTGVSGATVTVVDSAGKSIKMVTGSLGNFYSTTAVTFPASVTVSKCPDTVSMPVTISSGSCNGCHDGTTQARIHLP